jgi:O-antigen/teichoic acid export membrane protein
MSLSQKVGKAGILLAVRRVWGGIVTFLVMAYLARELNTEDFGVLAISTVLIQFIQTIAVSGIVEYALFYNGKNKKAVFNAIFWFSVAAALIVIIIVLLLVPLWADYYDNENIITIVHLLLFAFFFQLLEELPKAIFKKNIDFKPIVKIQMITNTITNIAKVGFAFYGFGVLSLALPTAIFAPFSAIAFFWKARFIPQRSLGLTYWKQILDFTKYVIGERIITRVISEGDKLIIGSVWGIQQLGIYALAKEFAGLLPTNLIPTITNITMPLMAKNNHNIEIVKKNFYKILRVMMFTITPMLVVTFIFSDFLITQIYGAKWEAAIFPTQVMLLFFIVKSSSAIPSSLYSILGRPKIGFYFTAVYFPLFLIGLWLCTSFLDFNEAIIGIFTVKLLASASHFVIAKKLLNDSFKKLFAEVGPIILLSVLGLLASLIISGTDFISATLSTLVFLTIVSLGFKLFLPNTLNDIITDIRSLIPKKEKNKTTQSTNQAPNTF